MRRELTQPAAAAAASPARKVEAMKKHKATTSGGPMPKSPTSLTPHSRRSLAHRIFAAISPAARRGNDALKIQQISGVRAIIEI